MTSSEIYIYFKKIPKEFFKKNENFISNIYPNVYNLSGGNILHSAIDIFENGPPEYLLNTQHKIESHFDCTYLNEDAMLKKDREEYIYIMFAGIGAFYPVVFGKRQRDKKHFNFLIKDHLLNYFPNYFVKYVLCDQRGIYYFTPQVFYSNFSQLHYNDKHSSPTGSCEHPYGHEHKFLKRCIEENPEILKKIKLNC